MRILSTTCSVISILSIQEVCNNTCIEVTYREHKHLYIAVLSPNSGIISKDGSEFQVIGEADRAALLDELDKS